MTRPGQTPFWSRWRDGQERCLKEGGTRFVFASDEFYLIAGRPLPAEETYEDYPQIENGVGMLRKFEMELEEALLEAPKGTQRGRVFTIPTGVSIAPWFREMTGRVGEHTGARFQIIPVPNDFFGRSIVVTGLIVGRDLIRALSGRIEGEALIIARTMLRENGDAFLDDMTLQEVQETLGLPIHPVWVDGEDFVKLVLSL